VPHAMVRSLRNPNAKLAYTPKTRKCAVKRLIPLHVRGALALLRRFAELEQCEAQRQALTAWVDQLAWMLEHPYRDRGAA
jgi:hypothetical protein